MTASRSFEAVVAVLETAIGHPDMVEFAKLTEHAPTFAAYEGSVHRGLGRTG